MGDSRKPETIKTETPAGAIFAIQRVYIKDLSFESPNAPKIFTSKEWRPDINLDLHTKAEILEEDLHEVVLKLTVTAKQDNNVAFIAEISQAGIFTIKGFAADQVQHVLGSLCPNVIYPFAREAIANVVTHGGFPQLLLAPVNFEALYAQHLKRQAEENLKVAAKGANA